MPFCRIEQSFRFPHAYDPQLFILAQDRSDVLWNLAADGTSEYFSEQFLHSPELRCEIAVKH